MSETFYNTAEFQAGITESVEKIQAIIDNLRLVENNVSSLGSELERYRSNESDFLQLKWTADSCIKDTNRALLVASNLQAKQASLRSLITNSKPNTHQARALTLEIQHDSGGFFEIVSSLKQSYKMMQELAQSLQTLGKRPQPWWKKYGACAVFALGAVGLVLGLVTGVAPILVILCGAATAVVSTLCNTGSALSDSNWTSLPGHISTAQDALEGILSLEHSMSSNTDKSLSLLDQYDAMQKRISELEEQLRQQG